MACYDSGLGNSVCNPGALSQLSYRRPGVPGTKVGCPPCLTFCRCEMAWSLNLPMWMPGQPLTVADHSTQCAPHSQTSFTPCGRGGQSNTDPHHHFHPQQFQVQSHWSSPLCWCFVPHGLVLDADFYSLFFLLLTLINSAHCQSFAWFLSNTCWFSLSAPRLCKQNLAATGYSGKCHWLTFCRCDMAWSLNLPMWMPGQPLTVADDSTQCAPQSRTSFTPCGRGGQSDTDTSPPLSPSTVSDTIPLVIPLVLVLHASWPCPWRWFLLTLFSAANTDKFC
jgi:hypothetical protein